MTFHAIRCGLYIANVRHEPRDVYSDGRKFDGFWIETLAGRPVEWFRLDWSAEDALEKCIATNAITLSECKPPLHT